MITSRTWKLAFVLLTAAFLVYAVALNAPFAFDDFHFVVNNTLIHTPANLAKLWTSASYNSAYPSQWGYRPFTLFLQSLTWIVGGGKPIAFHLVKIALHASVCLFLFFVWRRLWQIPGFYPSPTPRLKFPGKRLGGEFEVTPARAAALLALLFAIHPVNTEVVTYVSASTTLLAGTCYVAAYALYLRHRENGGLAAFFGSLSLYGLAVLAKEEGITLCAIVVLSEIFFPRRPRAWLRIFAYLAMGAIMAFVVKHFIADSAAIGRGDVERWTYFITQWRAYLRYFALILWPWDLNADNLEFGFSTSLRDGRVIAALVGNLGLLFFAWLQRRRAPVFLFALLWFYIAISPASSLVPLAEPVNDRRMYLAYFGLVGIFPWVLALISQLGRDRTKAEASAWSGVVLILVLLGLAAGTVVRGFVWRDPEALWSDTVEKNPHSPRALNNLALYYMGRGEWTQSIELLNRCLQVQVMVYPTCLTNLAIVYERLNQIGEAGQNYERSISLEPQNTATRGFYAGFLENNGRFPEAIVQFREIDRLTEGKNLAAKLGWARMARKLGSAEEAEQVLKSAIAEFGRTPEIEAMMPPGGGQ